MQKPFTLAVSGTRTGHMKAIEISLPSATKLRRLFIYRCLSVHRGVCLLSGGGVGGSAPGPGGGWGVPGPGRVGMVSQHALRQTPRERRPLLRTVRILLELECILVHDLFALAVSRTRTWTNGLDVFI